MRAKCALIGFWLTGEALFAADALGVREYSERCVGYFAQIYDVSPALVRAVIQVESAWQPGVVSSKGAMGLMQLMPATAEHFGVAHLFFIDENIRGGVHYLSDLLRLFPNDLPRTLAAYNAGENAVFKYAGVPPYNETMTYVKRALTVYYGSPYGQATWFPGSRGQKKLGGGFGSELLQPVAATAGMRYLGTH